MESTREHFIRTWNAEQPTFVKVLKALPGDQLDYKPHEKSSAAGDIAWFLAVAQKSLSEMFTKGTIDWVMEKRPDTLDEIVAAYESATETLRTHIASSTDELWDREVIFTYEGKEVMRGKVGEQLWGFLLDAIHHRGQLSTYIRPMGGRVPSIYGPSGDEK